MVFGKGSKSEKPPAPDPGNDADDLESHPVGSEIVHAPESPKNGRCLSSACCSVPPWRLLLLGCWVSFTSLTTYGMQDTILNIPADMLQNVTELSFRDHYQQKIGPHRQSALWGGIVAALALGAVFGSMCAIPLADRFGRKNVLLYQSNVIVVLGSVVMVVAQYAYAFELLILGRLILGISVGLSTTVLPMYLVEISPTAVRGFMASLHGVANNLAAAVGMILGLPEVLGNSSHWGLLLGFQGFFAMLQICTASWCPESPQFLYLSKNRKDSAMEIASTFDPENVKALRKKWDREAKVGAYLDAKLGWSGPIHHAAILAAFIGATRSFSGVTAWNTYSSSLLQAEGASERWGENLGIISQVVTVFTSLLNSLIIDRAGRRLCFLGGLMTINMVWVMVFVLGTIERYVTPGGALWSQYVRLISLEFSFSVVHPITAASCAWFLASELVPESVRARIQGVSMVSLWVVYLVTSLLYPIMTLELYSFSILILFIIPSFGIWLYLYFYLPETSMKSVVDIFSEFATGLPEDSQRDQPSSSASQDDAGNEKKRF